MPTQSLPRCWFSQHSRWTAVFADFLKVAITALLEILNPELCGFNSASFAEASSKTEAKRRMCVGARHCLKVLAECLAERHYALGLVINARVAAYNSSSADGRARAF